MNWFLMLIGVISMLIAAGTLISAIYVVLTSILDNFAMNIYIKIICAIAAVVLFLALMYANIRHDEYPKDTTAYCIICDAKVNQSSMMDLGNLEVCKSCHKKYSYIYEVAYEDGYDSGYNCGREDGYEHTRDYYIENYYELLGDKCVYTIEQTLENLENDDIIKILDILNNTYYSSIIFDNKLVADKTTMLIHDSSGECIDSLAHDHPKDMTSYQDDEWLLSHGYNYCSKCF